MSMITRVKGVPVFSKASEALIWGSEYGLTTYHAYKHGNENGYIAGSNLSRPRRMMKLSLKEKVSVNSRLIQAKVDRAIGNKVSEPSQASIQPPLEPNFTPSGSGNGSGY